MECGFTVSRKRLLKEDTLLLAHECVYTVRLPPFAVQAIRVSLEEQRQRQEDEAKRAQQASLEGAGGSQPEQQQEEPTGMDTGESVLASALSRELPSGGGITVADGPMVRGVGG